MRCQLAFNGKPVEANIGETLIDAALGGSMLIPQDCRSGQCQSCRVTVVSGAVDDHGTAYGRTVLACQATVSGDAKIEFEEMPLPVKRAGIITEINPLSPQVAEVVMTTNSSLEFRPGQYVRLKLSGFPAREFSPTCRLDGSRHAKELIFHIRRLPDGVVSREIGRTIKPGHPAHVQGPFGQAYLRDGKGPLILISGGAGWAPIWALARTARSQQRDRELIVIAGSRDVENLYMRPALDWLAEDGVREVIATSQNGASPSVRRGLPIHYVPLLGLEDTVHVAGPIGLVEAVKLKALNAHARCFADPFLASARTATLADKIVRKWQGFELFGRRGD